MTATIRIDLGHDGEAYWTLPSSLSRTYEAIPEPDQDDLRDVIEAVVGRFLLGLAGLLASGDIAGVELLDDAVRVQAEAAYGRLLRRREP